MFANTMQGGTLFGFPDVCKTPSPVGPIPIPYPNTAMCPTANPATASMKVFISNMPSMNLKSEFPMSQGDNAGVAGGVVSQTGMGPVKCSMGSTAVMIEGSPAVRLTSPTLHNGTNANVPGFSTVPGQVKVIIVR